MGHYAATVGGIATATDKGIILVHGSAVIVVGINDIVVGGDGTPNDYSAEFQVNLSTDAGTGGQAVTETKLKQSGPAPGGVSISGAWGTTEPADTAGGILHWGQNQRATFRWVALPGGEITNALAAADGVFLRTISLSTAWDVAATLHWIE